MLEKKILKKMDIDLNATKLYFSCLLKIGN